MRTAFFFTSLLLSQFALALPVVGEKVVYSGQALKIDGVYEIERSMEITEFNPLTRQFSVKIVFNQWGEGVSLGGFEQVVQVPEQQYLGIEQSLIPVIKAQCGTVFNPVDNARRITTSKEVLALEIGAKPACKVETPIMNGSKTVQWWSEEFSPFPVQVYESDLESSTSALMKIKSYYKPQVVAPAAEEKPVEEDKSKEPIFEDPTP